MNNDHHFKDSRFLSRMWFRIREAELMQHFTFQLPEFPNYLSSNKLKGSWYFVYFTYNKCTTNETQVWKLICDFFVSHPSSFISVKNVGCVLLPICNEQAWRAESGGEVRPLVKCALPVGRVKWPSSFWGRWKGQRDAFEDTRLPTF